MILLLACTEPEPATPPADTDTDTDDTGTPEGACEPAALPVESTYMPGFTGAEDFAFDGEGFMVSIDALGNLIGLDREGNQKVILADATLYGAGTRFLPDGQLVFCDAETGSLVRVDPATGGSVVVLSGLEYPNGLDVDLDGMVYVAEQISGKVRRIDPATGEYSVVAHGLYNPNGVSFSPDYETLYVGSFGAGVVWAVDRLEDGWSEARVYATTPESPGIPPDWCDTSTIGAECPMAGGYGTGACVDDGDADLYCASDRDTAACVGLEAGDVCTTEHFGAVVEQVCHTDGEDTFCPRTNAAYTEPCFGAEAYASCDVGGDNGVCYPTWEGVSACYLEGGLDAYIADCMDAAIGEDCVVDDPHYPSMGSCGDGTDWGTTGLVCLPSGVSWSEHGGLDGINVDTCGNVYVTEYTQGDIWRFDEEAGEAQLVVHVRSEWIPNMHWGNGVGGWEKDVLYVSDRARAGLFALEVGVEGHRDAYMPPE